MKYRSLYTALLMLLSALSHADLWSFDRELKTKDFQVGELVLTQIIDTRENQSYPEYSVRVKAKGKEIALFKNITFSKIDTFDNEKYILGVSNSGLSTFAYFILDSHGNLLRTENHSKSTYYCHRTVTLKREWVNDKDLDIKEGYESIENDINPDDPYVFLKSVTVNGCDGKRVEVWAL